MNKMTTSPVKTELEDSSKGGLGGEAEIGEGLWATGRLWLPLASG